MTREYYLRHQEAMKAKIRAYKQSLKESVYTVYYLPEEHYIGITNQLKIRMQNQRLNGKITDGYEVVMKVETKREALDIESKLHKLGYNGKHPQIK